MALQSSLIQIYKNKNFFFYLEQNYFFSAGLLGAFKTSFEKPHSIYFFFIDKLDLCIMVPLLFLPFYNQLRKYQKETLAERSLLMKKRFGHELQRSAVFFTNLVSRLIFASSEGFRDELKIIGVGYRFLTHLNLIVLKLGYSHLIIYLVPYTLNVHKKGRTSLVLLSSCYELLSEMIMFIKLFRIPNVYTGKGIRFKKESLLLKQGKTSQV